MNHQNADPVTPTDWRTAAVDRTSGESLAEGGLEYRTVDGDAALGAWLQADTRGFLEGELSDERVGSALARMRRDRYTGVYDPTVPDADVPVATIRSWVCGVSMPGGSTVASCAISAVTVAPTHRRRGIARALLEGELRRAAAARLPLASLTVTESAIYGRYGFGSAADAVALEIDPKRARWTGPTAPGRVDFVGRERAESVIRDVHERTRAQSPGDIDLPEFYEKRYSGTLPHDENGTKVRCVQYTDADGVVRGVSSYTVTPHETDFTLHTVDVKILLAESDDAYAALWRYFLELDLTGKVRAWLRAADEPVLWMISDRRAAEVSITDHHYLRVLDVPAVLSSRAYASAGVISLSVTDPLGLAGGRFLLTIDAEGVGRIEQEPETVPDSAVALEVSVTDLASLLLGGVTVLTLARAGRVRTSDRVAATRMLAWHEAPKLGIWY